MTGFDSRTRYQIIGGQTDKNRVEAIMYDIYYCFDEKKATSYEKIVALVKVLHHVFEEIELSQQLEKMKYGRGAANGQQRDS